MRRTASVRRQLALGQVTVSGIAVALAIVVITLALLNVAMLIGTSV